MKPVVHRGSVRTVDISLFPIWDKFTVRGKVEAEICEGGSQLKPQLLPQLFKSWGQVEAQIGAEVGVGILTLKPPNISSAKRHVRLSRLTSFKLIFPHPRLWNTSLVFARASLKVCVLGSCVFLLDRPSFGWVGFVPVRRDPRC